MYIDLEVNIKSGIKIVEDKHYTEYISSVIEDKIINVLAHKKFRYKTEEAMIELSLNKCFFTFDSIILRFNMLIFEYMGLSKNINDDEYIANLIYNSITSKRLTKWIEDEFIPAVNDIISVIYLPNQPFLIIPDEQYLIQFPYKKNVDVKWEYLYVRNYKFIE